MEMILRKFIEGFSLKTQKFKKSNFPFEIIKSQLQLDLEAKDEEKREQDRKIMEQRKMGNFI